MLLKSRMWFNTSSIRIKYSESLGVLRSIAHTDDVATVNTAINNEVINRNSAISTAINNEVVNRNNAIAATSSGINTGDETAASIRSKLGISTLSGVNTGDQTITLSGDVSGTGTGTISAVLSNSGVTAGTYNNSATQVRPFTVDAKGRITGIGVAVTITPAWSTISGKPTTLSGYGITDAYSSSNPNGYISSVPAQSFASLTGKPTTLAGYGITDSLSSLNTTFTGLLGITLPSGATADRGANVNGRIRYNTSLGITEGYGVNGWLGLTNVTLAVYAGNVGIVSGTITIPFDNSAPLVSEGTELWSQTVNPTVIGSNNKIQFSGMVDTSNNGRYVTIAIFKDSSLLGFVSIYNVTANRPTAFSIIVNDIATSLSSVTYSCRIGANGNTWYLGRGATATMGGVNKSGWSIEESL